MLILFLILLYLNIFTDILFYKKLVEQDILKRKNGLHYGICSGLRVLWILFGTWRAIPIPLLVAGLLLIVLLNIIPYHNRRLRLGNFSLVMYLIFVALLLIAIGAVGIFGMGISLLQGNMMIRVAVANIIYLFFYLIVYLLIHYYPNFFWRDDYDRSKVTIYTWFLFICVLYQWLDSVLITMYETERVNDILLLIGNILIAILAFNFMNYNYEFVRSKEARREYEESEILIAQQYFEKQELKKLSSLDSLTKAYNRREISALMEKSIQQGHQLICAFIDLDGLKEINDTYGHACGDQMLMRFADASTEILQEEGYLARIGGDEFLLIFLDQELAEVDKRIKKLQEELLKPKEEKNRVSFSYGIAQGEDSVENYILQADRQMYLDKNRKRCGDICM